MRDIEDLRKQLLTEVYAMSFGGGADTAGPIKVSGMPNEGRRLQCADGMAIFVSKDTIYWWDNGKFHVAKPTEPPENYCDGFFTLPDNFTREWELYVRSADIAQSDFKTAAD